MFKNRRHTEILEIIKQEGFAEVRALSERLYASQPTVRRDLTFLEREGYIRRSHGGAILADEKSNTPVSFRRVTRNQEKLRICRLASTLIRPGNLIFTDASTTASHLAEFLKEEDNVTVVTNGYPICLALSERNIRTFSTGGRMLKRSLAFVGRQAEDAVRGFNADLLFFSSSALGEDGTISDYSEEETALRRAMRLYSRKAVFLCDSGKFGTASAFRAFHLSEVEYAVTDAPLPPALLNASGMRPLKEQDGAILYGRDE